MSVNINDWKVEDLAFWKEKGSKIATRNILISIPSLLLAFAVWIMWGIIITKMKEFGYNFGMLEGISDALRADKLKEINSLYYTLPAIAGLAGATLRIPNSFLIGLAGGRNVIFVTTLLLIIPVVGVGLALRDINTPYMVFAAMALLSGFGGGNFASSMSNISYFFPKRVQGTSLGFNAGIGNLGVGIMQKTIPLVVGLTLFSAVDRDGSVISSGALTGIQNAGWIWVPFLVICSIAAFFGMNNVITGTPKLPNTLQGLGKTFYMVLLGLIAAGIGAYFLVGLKVNMWIVLPVVVILTILLMKYATPGEIKTNLEAQFSIFKDKHNWIMTIIYTMTFGSFIGFSAAFPKLCQDIFVYSDAVNPEFVNPNAPNFLMWVFLGPVIGALIRPVGGWLSDKVNSGSRVTTISTIFQIIAALAVAYFIKEAKQSPNPEDYWWPFFACFMILFATTGIGNGSTFRSIPYIFSQKLAGPVLGWTSAIAAYGAFIIPKVFGAQISAGTPEYALYGFALYYLLCLGLNWYYYDRRNSGIKC
ncbi:MAG: NarK/NasA family nitrate transporter [Bacteroidetes bacterium]|nr:NarK/NasA family nitrate transporter [Bacteroidota bacterium]MBT3751509.1 NarK/NasA family nitrate transporter [Bacteroidota bacterium]MBT4398710.1 NarK/NasA family nitrate transporter [Bacteroidota bacterium]MBT4411635.1 NarK/NasA family nitrate transporter [Bacteroidota bacterium]MBT7093197.1 NarK/NasA family nitrate transporter [Bacteroidota bacterium]